jgi:HEAT repeat protein
VRILAGLALEDMGSTAGPAVPELIRSLTEPVDYVRYSAAAALGAVGSAAYPAIQPLVARLLDKNEDGLVLNGVAIALGNMSTAAKEALPALEEASKSRRLGAAGPDAILKVRGEPAPTWW